MNARVVPGDFFHTLGLRPTLGRLFAGEETERGAEPVAVLGYGYWQRVYGGDPDVVGKTLVTDAFTATVVGVMPAGTG